MSKEFPPDPEKQIADPTKTEGTFLAPGIPGNAGGGLSSRANSSVPIQSKVYLEKGDATRMERKPNEIHEAGKGQSFLKNEEGYVDMLQRRETSKLEKSSLIDSNKLNEPKVYYEKGDATRIERKPNEIHEAGKGNTFLKNEEGYSEMLNRRDGTKLNLTESVLDKKPNLFKEAIKKESSETLPTSKVNEVMNVKESQSNSMKEVKSNKPNLFHEAVKNMQSKMQSNSKENIAEKEKVVEKGKPIEIDKGK